jgi:ribosomal protein S18 acetylase RimI-like enzyme
VAEILIRPVTDDDSDAIAEMWLALVAYHLALDPSLPPAAPGGEHRYVRRMLSRLDDPYTRTLVAEIDGRVVGFVLGMILDLIPDIFDQSPGGFLADIYVEPDHRRNGVGRTLVESLKVWFREQGVDHFEWHVAARNPAGQAFWRSVGGREVMIRMSANLGDSTA